MLRTNSFLTTGLVLFISVAAFGQGAPTDAGPPAGGSDKNLSRGNIKSRSLEMERIRKTTDSDGGLQPGTNKFAEIKEDFEKLQLLNTNSLQPEAEKKPIDLKLIRRSADEMGKRARRLNRNLFGIKSRKKKKKPSKAARRATAEDLKGFVIALDNSLMRFVGSPIFNTKTVVKQEKMLAAQKELKRMIELCDVIDHSASVLSLKEEQSKK